MNCSLGNRESIDPLKNKLLSELENIELFENCALFHYPHHPNVGDHLIWLSQIHWLFKYHPGALKYSSSMYDFKSSRFLDQREDTVIFISAGGYFGDIYPYNLKHALDIVERFPKHKIVILPQSVYFTSDNELSRRAIRVLGDHSNVTLFTRDKISYEIASNQYKNTRIKLCPDMSILAVDILKACAGDKFSGKGALYSFRNDEEAALDRRIPTLQQQETIIYRPRTIIEKKIDWYRFRIKSAASYTGIPKESSFTIFQPEFVKQAISNHLCYYHRLSMRLVQEEASRLLLYEKVLTDRLHIGLLAFYLGKECILYPNGYHKNKSLYETWFRDLPNIQYHNE